MEHKFSVTTHGKWILSGEHAVIRGGWALAFPLRGRKLTLDFTSHPGEDSFIFEGASGKEFQLLFETVMSRAFEVLKVPSAARAQYQGHFRLSSDLPVGSGLGASASLVVAIGKWAHAMGLLPEAEIFEFARTLENLFHGESSGLDVAVTLSNRAVKFRRGSGRVEMVPFESSELPFMTISSTGIRGITSECVMRVKQFAERNSVRARELDALMAESVALCESALAVGEVERLEKLKLGIEKAELCFREWGLTEGAVDSHIQQLRSAGAVAVKPTGSGGGGYVLSLWSEVPKPDVAHALGLIPVS